MAVLREETRNRWSALTPDKFISTVLYGALSDQIKLASTFISVYTQIMHNLPRTQPLRMENHKAVVELRRILKHVRTHITDARDTLHGDNTPTIPVSSYTDEGYILQTVKAVRQSINQIDAGLCKIEANPDMLSIPMPGSNGRLVRSVVSDIRDYLSEITQLLDFAQQYAERIYERSGRKPYP